MALHPDKTALVTGSADKEVKFWDFELITDEAGGQVRIIMISFLLFLEFLINPLLSENEAIVVASHEKFENVG
jgi:U3 small nucleolar RNA-associated protein 12